MAVSGIMLLAGNAMGQGEKSAATVQAEAMTAAFRAADALEASTVRSSALLEDGSKLRGKRALQMDAIRSNMERLQQMGALSPSAPTGAGARRPLDGDAEASGPAAQQKAVDDQELQGALVADANATTSENEELSRGAEDVASTVQLAKTTVGRGDHKVSQMTMKQVMSHQENLAKVMKHLDSTHDFLKRQLEKARTAEANRLSSTTNSHLQGVVDKVVRKRIQEKLDSMDTILARKVDEKVNAEAGKLAARVEQIATHALRDNVVRAVHSILDPERNNSATAGLDHLVVERVRAALDKRLAEEVSSQVENATSGLTGLRMTNLEDMHGFSDFRPQGPPPKQGDQTKWKKAQGNHTSHEIHPTEADLDPNNIKKDVNGKPMFRYSTGTGYSPSNWGEISPEYQTCKSGREQSPVDVKQAQRGKRVAGGNVHVRTELPDMQVAYQTFSAERIVHNGHAPMIGFPQGKNGSLVYDGDTFNYKQFHIHSPGEHAFDGKRPAMTFHLVHEAPNVHEGMNTRFALISVPFEIESDGEPFLSGFFNRLPSPPGEGATEPTYVSLEDVQLSLANALFDAPEGQPWASISSADFYTYHGSLSTPPCTENVKYFLMKKPLRVTDEQVAKLRAVLPDTQNARPLMNKQWAEEPVVYTKSLEPVKPRKSLPTLVKKPAPEKPSAAPSQTVKPSYGNTARFKATSETAASAPQSEADKNLEEASADATEVLRQLNMKQ